jgi:putative DNA primase/helicase
MNAAEIASRLGLRRASGGWAGDCPGCGYAGAFRVKERDGRALWACGACQDRNVLTEAVMGRRQSASRETGPRTDPAAASKRERALRLWDDALPLDGTLAADYLTTRGLAAPDGGALRYLPDAKHPTGARAACMIALAVDAAGRGVAVHRTYLAHGGAGKAALDPPRATLAPIGGAVVRLCHWRAGKPLVIAEGIETALSAGAMTGAAAWAALSAGNMAAVPLPDAVREVVIAADNDPPGLRAAWAAADAYTAQGRRVRVIQPQTRGDDFNDLLQRQRAQEPSHA